MEKKWAVKTVDDVGVENLSRLLGVGSITARILIGRGIDAVEDGRQYLLPSLSAMHDPFLLKGMQTAVERVLLALENSETVCVYGDYDVDGITGTALLVSFLRQVGLICNYFIPSRFDDGYGLNEEALQRIIDTGATLIISVDCGITAVKEAIFCRHAGVDLVILDHHAPREIIPEATAVVNPLQPGCSYPFKMLAGVGVAFNLLVALRSRMRLAGLFGISDEPDLRDWLDLVALGTIADVVPLVGQNRTYAYYGLQKLESSRRPGIAALKKVAGIKDTVNCGQVGFRLAPRLNAAGRMESAVPGVDLLLNNSADECAIIADELDTANAERQAVERGILEQAVAMVDSGGNYPACRSIVLASRDWHQGVIGIVASRLVERYHRPTILIAIDEEGKAKGSGRSIPGFHLLEALTACPDYLDRFGGHRYAAGIGLEAGNIDAFAAAFEAASLQILGDRELVPSLDIDGDVCPAEVNLTLTNEFKRMEPFGAGNPEPTLMMRRVTVVDRRIVGEGHLKLRLSAGGLVFSGIAFRQAECPADGLLDIAFFPESNFWNNATTLQLRIKAMRKAAS
ncbi:MAG: single-stranded-DNA-specific exonuclease RecJ [Deltaproteobacteria bacterium]|jgi:single-stranded-DNA-specific exonuclease|nr:single-stranded-DNA-specific exonuclease RecJ [Deltaproteobacteria bacterium]